ncbi:MAG: UDP-4-amino-4,6-dideoxy-N-acetyl-beta-L-altrosamine transaminase [Methanobrevibacter sp.]|uniref:UDP-4-amino-4, 6-dideoxy-N-acetyl-beta-L-altrosamine transaminase n=1 Tax=Methanobrevibacter sp. TaxID=66852 RepID=UPI0026DFED95|nr:UDP-4-amino-4,6-dideoxy-N-acetyl-beta-L-altrosamine transaminase [Methanobrevibacter sp.]MDO5848692.1 UDP-4-amino-4,6-dideoxy-N-acetyl-beta-L-altrosamine transaminase [Methanobrevibacter sp.]
MISISKFLPYGKQTMDQDDIDSVVEVLHADFITQGPKINEFEEGIAKYCGAKYAVAFNSGTSALHGAYFALGLNPGDEMITSPNTFVATSNAALYLGAKPVFGDVQAETGNLDPLKVADKITDKTKFIAPVHYSGNPCDMKAFAEIAEENDIKLIEDAAHALGAKYDGKPIGSLEYSEMAMFSFHPVKHITTGEGGIIVTNDEEYYNRLQLFRSHGITKENLVNESDGDWYYEMQHLGYNYRITDIQCALGISQLKKLDSFVNSRREIAKKYDGMFEDNPYFDVIEETPNAESAYHLYPILLKDKYLKNKREIFSRLREEGIGVQIHYIPVYRQPYYRELGYPQDSCPVDEEFYLRELSIPMYPTLTDDDLEFVQEKLYKVISEFD